jgi:hypothetical protein
MLKRMQWRDLKKGERVLDLFVRKLRCKAAAERQKAAPALE